MRVVTFLFLTCAFALADSKSEAILKVQLATAKAQHDQDLKDKQQLALKLSEIQSNQKVQQSAIITNTRSVDATQQSTLEASRKTSGDLQILQETVDNNAALARIAEANAQIERAKTATALIAAKSAGITTLIEKIFYILGICALPLLTWWINKRTTAKVLTSLNSVNTAVAEAKVETHSASVAVDSVKHNLQELDNSRQETAKLQSAQLTQIHSLVNSNLTAAKKDELESREANLVLMHEAIEAKSAAGLPPSKAALGLIDATVIKINELKVQLADRERQTVEAEQQLKVDLKKAYGLGAETF
jgi:hypothetical protein